MRPLFRSLVSPADPMRETQEFEAVREALRRATSGDSAPSGDRRSDRALRDAKKRAKRNMGAADHWR